MTSIETQRAAIVNALALTLDDGTGLASRPSAPDVVAQFDAWPVWDSSVWTNRCVQSHTWRVYVAVPNADAMGANESADLLLGPVGEALWALGHVDRAQPVTWATDGMQGYPCVQFTVTI